MYICTFQGEFLVGCVVELPPGPVGLDDILAQGREDADGQHPDPGGRQGQPHLEPHPRHQTPEQLLQEHVGGQEHGDSDGGEKEAVGGGGLGGGGHELLVVQADQQADGEEREQAAVEHLRYQDHVHARN